MNIKNLPRINQLSSISNAFNSAIKSLELGSYITMTIPKSANGPGAQLQVRLTTEDIDYVNKVLLNQLDEANIELKELGVEL